MDFFDLHCDTPYECYSKNQKFYVNRLAVSGKAGECFEDWYQTFAIWIRDDAQQPFELYKAILSSFKERLLDKPQNLTPLFSVEGGRVIENDLDRLYALKNDGIKFLTLTWNGENSIAGGCKSEKGLTPFGKQAIYEMNALNIACDLSHLNEKSFYSAIQLADKPLATHSNCKEIWFNERNLTDCQIKLLCQKGGIIGLCFYPDFLGENVFEKIYENIFHICDLGFENHIAIGSDFDGGKMSSMLDNISKVPELFEFLRSKGLGEQLLYKVFYKNAYNYIANLQKKSYYGLDVKF